MGVNAVLPKISELAAWILARQLASGPTHYTTLKPEKLSRIQRHCFFPRPDLSLRLKTPMRYSIVVDDARDLRTAEQRGAPPAFELA